MTRGRKTCKILKEIRQQIADKNDIEYITSECHFQGECKGTCPKCESEVKYLENELYKRKQLGKAATIAGISLGIAGMVSGCGVQQQVTTSNFSSTYSQMDDFGGEVAITGQISETVWDDNNIMDGQSDTANVYIPRYPGGSKAYIEFLQKNLVYPQQAKEQEIEGNVYVEFLVTKDGTLTDISVKISVDETCDEEAIRLVKLMPKWKPAVINGRPENMRIWGMVIPFTLTSDIEREVQKIVDRDVARATASNVIPQEELDKMREMEKDKRNRRKERRVNYDLHLDFTSDEE